MIVHSRVAGMVLYHTILEEFMVWYHPLTRSPKIFGDPGIFFGDPQ